MSGYYINVGFYVFGIHASEDIANIDAGYFAHSSVVGVDDGFPSGELRIPVEELTELQQAPCTGLSQYEIEGNIGFTT